MTNPTSLRHYFLGRSQPRWLVVTWLATLTASILFWDQAMELPGAPNGAKLSARITVPLVGLLTHLWLVAPGMPSWERTAVRRVRLLNATAVCTGLLLAPAVVFATVTLVSTDRTS